MFVVPFSPTLGLSHSHSPFHTHSNWHSPQCCSLSLSLSLTRSLSLSLLLPAVYVFFNAHHYHSVCVLNRRSATESRQTAQLAALTVSLPFPLPSSPPSIFLSPTRSLTLSQANKGKSLWFSLLLPFCFARSLVDFFVRECYISSVCVCLFVCCMSVFVCESICVWVCLCIYTPSTNNKRIQQTRNRKFWHFYTWLAATRNQPNNLPHTHSSPSPLLLPPLYHSLSRLSSLTIFLPGTKLFLGCLMEPGAFFSSKVEHMRCVYVCVRVCACLCVFVHVCACANVFVWMEMGLFGLIL